MTISGMQDHEQIGDNEMNSSTDNQKSRSNKLYKRIFPYGWCTDSLDLIKLAIPICINFILMILPQFTSVIMNGHRNRIEQAAVFLANSVINTLIVVPLEGFGMGAGTFYSQIYGSGNYNRLNVILKRSSLIICCIVLIIMSILFNIEGILVSSGQQNIIAKITANYLIICSPGICFYAIATALVPFLQCQNNVSIPMLFSLIQNIFNVVTQAVLLFVFKFDYRASAASTAASYGVNALLLLLYFKFSNVLHLNERSTEGEKREKRWICLTEWSEILKLGIPGIVLMGFGVMASEIISFVSGYIDSVEMSATSIAYQTSAFMLMMFIGLGTAVSIRVGQYLGAGDPCHASSIVRVALSISFSFAIISSLIFIPLRRYVASMFSSDIHVIERGSQLLIAVYVMLGVDALNEIFVCTMRGCGKQKFAAISLVVVYYGLGMPVGIPLALLTNLKIMGLWIAYASSLTLVALIYGVVIYRMDWVLLSKEAVERATGITASNTQDIPNESNIHSLNARKTEGAPLVKNDSCDQSNNGSINNVLVEIVSKRELFQKCMIFIFLVLILVVSVLIWFFVPIPQFPISCAFLGEFQKDMNFHNITCRNTTV